VFVVARLRRVEDNAALPFRQAEDCLSVSIILIGDRNLQIDGRPDGPGPFNATTNHELNWTRDLHRLGGNLGFTDGHAEWCRTNGLNNIFREQRLAASRLVIP
jgi:prepilin-type processing-associated H-X9-DG protein